MATLAVAGIGALIGWGAVGTAAAIQTGWLIGSIAGAFLLAKDGGEDTTQEGSRIDDLSSQTSEWGKPIPRVFGSYRLAGNVIWSIPLKETKHIDESDSGGKGGQGGTTNTTITYTYSASWAVGLCEGEMNRIKKIWFDSVLVYDGSKYSGGLTVSNHDFYPGSSTQTPSWIIQSSESDTPAYRNLCYLVFNDIQLENYGNRVPSVSVELASSSSGTEVASDVIESILLRAGLESSQFDVSSATDTIYGFVVSKPMSARSACNAFTPAFQYDMMEYDNEIKIIPRSGTSIADVYEDNLISVNKIEVRQELEASKTITIQYINASNAYSPAIQSTSRIDTNSTQIKIYQFALVLSDNFAKQLSEKLIYNEWNERIQFEFEVSSEFLFLKPSDVIMLHYEGLVHKVRLTDITFTVDNSVSCKGTSENNEVYFSSAVGSPTNDTYIESSVVSYEQPTLKVLDIPTLDKSLDFLGVYLACNILEDNWKGCNIAKTNNLDTPYTYISSVFSSTVTGTTTTILSDGPTTLFDQTNSVTVQTTSGSLFDVTLEDLLNSSNYILIGSEVLQYRDATDNGGGSYTLSFLMRGRRGTEWATGTHTIGEEFVFLSSNLGFARIETHNIQHFFSASTFGTVSQEGTTESIVPTGISKKPFSPSSVEAIRAPNDDIQFTWRKRSRDVTGYFGTLSDAEEYIIFRITIQTGAAPILKDMSFSEYLYTAIDQAADGLTVGAPIDYSVCQISTQVGEGYHINGNV